MENQRKDGLSLSNSVTGNLPAMVRNHLAKMPAQKQEEFLEEYMRKEKSVAVGYLCWFILGIHYAYVRKWGLQVVYWLTIGGLLFWMIIDIFRIPKIIGDYNKDLSIEIMRDLKAMD